MLLTTVAAGCGSSPADDEARLDVALYQFWRPVTEDTTFWQVKLANGTWGGEGLQLQVYTAATGQVVDLQYVLEPGGGLPSESGPLTNFNDTLVIVIGPQPVFRVVASYRDGSVIESDPFPLRAGIVAGARLHATARAIEPDGNRCSALVPGSAVDVPVAGFDIAAEIDVRADDSVDDGALADVAICQGDTVLAYGQQHAAVHVESAAAEGLRAVFFLRSEAPADFEVSVAVAYEPAPLPFPWHSARPK